MNQQLPAVRDGWNSGLLRWLPRVAAFVLLALLVMIAFEMWVLLRPIPTDTPLKQYGELMSKQLWMRATKTLMGYALGVLCVGAGVIFAWNSVESTVQVSAERGDSKFNLATGSVGVVFVVVGVLLVAATILAPETRIGPSSSSGGPESAVPDVANKNPYIPFEL